MSRVGRTPTEPDLNDGHAFEQVVDRLQQVAEAETFALGDLIEAGGSTSFVPAMMIPALIVVSPLSGIPLLPTVMGLTIGQMLIGRRHLWLPGVLMRRQLRGARVGPAVARTTGVARWIDRHSRNRLRPLTAVPLVKIPQALAMLCGLAMPFLELVPFSSSLLGVAVLFLSAGFLSRDGVYIIGGMAMIGIAALVPLTIWLQFTG